MRLPAAISGEGCRAEVNTQAGFSSVWFHELRLGTPENRWNSLSTWRRRSAYRNVPPPDHQNRHRIHGPLTIRAPFLQKAISGSGHNKTDDFVYAR